MNRLYALPLCGVILCALMAPIAVAQSALPSPVADPLAKRQTQVERLVSLFDAPAETARFAQADTYVLNQRTVYVPDETFSFQPSAQSRFEYEGTQRTEETSYVWSGDSYVEDERTRFVYSGNLLLRREVEKWDPTANGGAGGWVYTNQTINTYAGSQGSGMPTGVLYQVRNGDEWQNVERTLYTVSGTGLNAYYSMVEFEEWVGGDDPWEATALTFIAQDGDDVVITNQEPAGTAWVTTEVTRFLDITILEINALLRELPQELEDFTSIFLAVADIPDHVTQSYEGGVLVGTERQRTFKSYSGHTGALIHAAVTSEILEGEQWLPQSRLVTVLEPIEGTSDSFPTHTDLEEYDPDAESPEEAWVLSFRESYTRDEASGRVGSVTWEFPGEEEEESFAFMRIEFDWQPAGTTSTDPGPVAGHLTLDTPYPNPAAGSATIAFRLAAPGHVSLRVYDLLGRQVATLLEGVQGAGEHPVRIDAAALPSGRYFVRLEAPGVQQTRPLTVVR